nr:ribonuclease H-like domain-containing protein [Tanacetum cinerariifolium]
NLIESQRSDKSKEGLGYTAVPPPAQLYLSPKKDLSWTGLLACVDDTVTDYSRPSPTVESSSEEDQNRNPSVFENVASPIIPKLLVKAVPRIILMTKAIGTVAARGGCKIIGKETFKKGKLEFENVYFVKDLKYNLFSVSQICDNKNSVLFTDSECIVLGRDFKLLDDATILLRTPRQHNMYSIDLNNIIPHRDLTCLVAKASAEECMIWHRRIGHLNFKTMNKLVRHNLVRGLPTKCFENDHNCTACPKRKQHKVSCKSKLVNSVSKPLHTLHMDLFGPTSTSDTLRKFITKIENLKDLKVKIIRVLVNKAHNKTPYELFNGRTPAIGFLKPFGCYVMILNTLDNLGKFEAKGDEGYFLRYSMSSKAFRVFNKRTKKVEESLHIEFLENKAIEKGYGPNWLFDIDSLTKSMNYVPVVDAGTNSTNFSGTKVDARQDVKKDVSSLRYIVLPNWVHEEHLESHSSQSQDACCNTPKLGRSGILSLGQPSSKTRLILKRVTNQAETPSLDNILTLSNQFEDILEVTTNLEESSGVEPDVSNVETTIIASPTPTLRILRDHPKRVRPIGTKWVLKNKKDERGIVIKNKSRLVAQGHTLEEWIDYDEVFTPVARIEAIRLFLAYASFMGFTVYQMDVKSAFLYGTIDEEVYVMQPPGYQDPEYLARVYKVEKLCMDYIRLLELGMGKDGTGKDVDLHLYRSMIGSLMYLTASRPDIMFAICACAWHQVTYKECHLHSVKRIFRYLKGHPKLGLWYPKDSPFDLVAYSDSDYGGTTQDRKSTTGGCQFLGRRLISWQCKKQTIVATSTTEAEYVAAASCCGQVLWIQN